MIGLLERQWLLPLGVVVGYVILMGTNAVRHSLLDGLRAIQRYPLLWAIPAGLGLCYALFHAGLTVFFYTVLPMQDQPAFGWKFAWEIPHRVSQLSETHSLSDWLSVVSSDVRWQVARDAGLDGLEALAGLFNNVVTTFPLSAVAAVMLLVNWEDHHRTLRNGLGVAGACGDPFVRGIGDRCACVVRAESYFSRSCRAWAAACAVGIADRLVFLALLLSVRGGGADLSHPDCVHVAARADVDAGPFDGSGDPAIFIRGEMGGGGDGVQFAVD
jgi:hypothetical protein